MFGVSLEDLFVVWNTAVSLKQKCLLGSTTSFGVCEWLLGLWFLVVCAHSAWRAVRVCDKTFISFGPFGSSLP